VIRRVMTTLVSDVDLGDHDADEVAAAWSQFRDPGDVVKLPDGMAIVNLLSRDRL
jgi:hypothetical protein